MLSKVLTLPDHEVLAYAAPSLVLSLAIAELFYKFHSFIFEASAMLATWWVLATITRLIMSSRRDTV